MVKRGVSGIIGIGLFLSLCFGGLLPFAIGATVVATLATWEWTNAFRRALKIETSAGDLSSMPAWLNHLNAILAFAGILFPPLAYLLLCHRQATQPLPGSLILLSVPVVVCLFLTWRASRTGHVLGESRRWYGAIGLIYIGFLMSSLVWLRGLSLTLTMNSARTTGGDTFDGWRTHHVGTAPFTWAEQGAWLMLFVAVCVWGTDTGAYAVGKTLGRHKLSDLSPGKTVEGAIGGLCAALLTGACFGLWIHLPLHDGLAIGLIAGVMGQCGDLFESALKRELGVKDFGTIMPGHGGALDRFDSLLFVAPLAFCYLHFLGGF